MNIKNLFVNGRKAEISKEVLSDDVSQNLLPSTTLEDAGKVPTVQEDGSYALATAGGGGSGGAFIVTDTDGTLDKTWAAISAADANNVVIVKVNNISWFMYGAYTNNEDIYSIFCMSYVSSGKDDGCVCHVYTTTTENGYPVLGG